MVCSQWFNDLDDDEDVKRWAFTTTTRSFFGWQTKKRKLCKRSQKSFTFVRSKRKSFINVTLFLFWFVESRWLLSELAALARERGQEWKPKWISPPSSSPWRANERIITIHYYWNSDDYHPVGWCSLRRLLVTHADHQGNQGPPNSNNKPKPKLRTSCASAFAFVCFPTAIEHWAASAAAMVPCINARAIVHIQGWMIIVDADDDDVSLSPLPLPKIRKSLFDDFIFKHSSTLQWRQDFVINDH